MVTSNTVSSSFIIKNLKFKKTIHQFFPIDCNFISKKFLNYWKPAKAFFIDSEIWPNISEKKEPPADAEEWQNVKDKFNKHFSEKPGEK